MESLREIHMQQRKGLQIILFPVPLQGHLNPMLQLANILYSKGFSITIIHTQFNSPNASNYPLFTFYPIPDSLSENEASTADILELLTLLNVNCVGPFRDCLAKLMKDVSDYEKEPVACMISDAVFYCTKYVAESLKVPRIVLRTSNVSAFLAFATFPLLREKGYFVIKDSEALEELIPELSPLKVKDIPTINTKDQETLHQVIGQMVEETKGSSGLIWNSFEDLEHIALTTCRQEFPIPIFPIGPFHKYFKASPSSLLTQDQSSISWLNTKPPNSVIYVSFGSIALIEQTKFLELAWGLANSNQPFLWVVRPGLIDGSEWLEPLPDDFLEKLGGRGHIVKWAPQQEVLAHDAIGGFWTHCGWNSILESICEGVPMICMPCFGDQRVNARYVSDVWRIGLHLEHRMEREEVERAIRRVMVEEEGEEMRERLVHLKEKVDLCLRPSGSSYKYLENLIRYISSI